MQQQQCQQLIYIYRDFAKAEIFSFKYIHQTADHPNSVRIHLSVCEDACRSVRIQQGVCEDDT